MISPIIKLKLGDIWYL